MSLFDWLNTKRISVLAFTATLLLIGLYWISVTPISLTSEDDRADFEISILYKKTDPIWIEKNLIKELEDKIVDIGVFKGYEIEVAEESSSIQLELKSGFDKAKTIRSTLLQEVKECLGDFEVIDVQVKTIVPREDLRIEIAYTTPKEDELKRELINQITNYFKDSLFVKGVLFDEDIEQGQSYTEYNQNLYKKDYNKVVDLKERIIHTKNGNYILKETDGNDILGAYSGSGDDFIEIKNFIRIEENTARDKRLVINGKEVETFTVLIENKVINLYQYEPNELIDNLNKRFSQSQFFSYTDNVSDKIRLINDFGIKLIVTIVTLSILILLVYRSIKIAYVSGLLLLVNLIIALSVIQIPLSDFVLAGALISLGFLTDNYLVLIDTLNSNRDDLKRTVVILLSSALTTSASVLVISYFVVEYWSGIFDLSLIIIVNLLISILVSIFIVPAFTFETKVVGNGAKGGLVRFMLFLQRKRRWVFTILILTFGLPIHLLPERIKKEVGLKFVEPYIGGVYYHFSENVNVDLGGLPKRSSTPDITVNIKFNGDGVFQNELNQQLINSIKSKLADSGNISDYKLHIEDQGLTIDINTLVKGGLEKELIDRLEKFLFYLGKMSWTIKSKRYDEKSSYNAYKQRSYCLKISGYNYPSLYVNLRKLNEELNGNERILDIEINERSNDKLIRREIASKNYYESETFLDHKMSKIENSIIESKDLEYLHGKDYWTIFNDPNYNLSDNVVNVEYENDKVTLPPLRLFKLGSDFHHSISFNYNGSMFAAEKLVSRIIEKYNLDLPEGFKIERVDNGYVEREKKESVLHSSTLMVGTSILLVVLLLFVFFTKLSKVMVVILSIPFSLIGFLSSILAFNLNYGLGTLCSLVILIGASVNYSIVVLGSNKNDLDVVNIISKKGKVIALSMMTTVFSFVPIVYLNGVDSFWFPFSITLAMGLLFSWLYLYLLLPLFYVKK